MTGTHINLKLDKICRGCLSEDGIMTSVFQNDVESDVSRMFESCTSLQIKENDGFPTQMCSSCILRLHESYQFRQMCIQSDVNVRALKNEAEISTEVCSIKIFTKTEQSSYLRSNCDSDIELEEKCEFLNSDVYDNEDYEEDKINESNKDNLNSYYQCATCSEKFHNYRSLKRHEFELHVPENICTVCSKAVTTLEEFMNHPCKLLSGKANMRKYQCKECDKEYTSSHNLQIHMYSHSGVKPFSCEYCGKSFTKVNSLNSHVSLHTGYLSYLCSECGKGFSTSTGLKRHKISHSGERPYKCKLCPASFAASGDLTVHMRSHTGEKPYLCPTCGKAFSRVSHLNTHARTHTGEKPYKCLRCDRAFAQSGDLRSHERTHTGEKPYGCPVCKKRFIQSSGLTSHMRTHTGEKSYRCSLCHKAFSQPSSLTRHRRCHNE